MAYIKLEDALQVCSEAEEWYTETNEQQCAVVSDDIYQQIANLPTADVVEVKHGYNATKLHPVDEFICSECGFTCDGYTEAIYDEEGDYTYYCECEFNYCPKCGAKMDGGVTDEQV